MEPAKIALLIIAIATGGYAILGIVHGKIYCKGGPYSRSDEPAKFWVSVVIYIAWCAMMNYFLFIKTGHP